MVAGAIVAVGTLGGAITMAANDSFPWITGAAIEDQQASNAPGEQPVDYWPFRIIPSDHPEAEVFWRKAPPGQRAPETFANTLEDVRTLIPEFKEPSFLPNGLALTYIEAVRAPNQYNVEAVYTSEDTRMHVRILQQLVRRLPIPVIKPAYHPFEELRTGTLGSLPAVLRVPKEGVKVTNPKEINWVRDRVQFHLRGYGFDSLDPLMQVALSLK